MSQYQTFNFRGYNFDPISKELELHYGYDEQLNFTETYKFDFDFTDYNQAALNVGLENLFLLAGVSYYKAYLAPELLVPDDCVSPQQSAFLSKTYRRGLGEFFYVNNLDPNLEINFPVTRVDNFPVHNSGSGLLIGVGGGKDSLVTIEALKDQPKVATWSVGHRSQLEPLVAKIGLPHLWVERTWDNQLLSLNTEGAYNGHVPISAILAAVGTVVAILAGYQDVIVSNEHSANEATLDYRGTAINHQYSKSLEFETDYQTLLLSQFDDSTRYYSFLRPLSELKIAELFVATAFERYAHVFSSCNRAYTRGSAMGWCGNCPKCAFVYLILANFTDRTDLLQLFSGRNLLADPALESTYRNLLGIEGNKPLECIGEIQESRLAMHQLQEHFIDLRKYKFELSPAYNYSELHKHSMPVEIYRQLTLLVDNQTGGPDNVIKQGTDG